MSIYSDAMKYAENVEWTTIYVKVSDDNFDAVFAEIHRVFRTCSVPLSSVYCVMESSQWLLRISAPLAVLEYLHGILGM